MIIANKLSRVAIERSAEKRAHFAACIGTYDPNQLVFVDESAVDRRTTYRGRAWAIRGRKATRKAFFCRGKRYVCTVLHIVSYQIEPLISFQGTLCFLHYRLRKEFSTVTYLKGPSTPLPFTSLSSELWIKCNRFPPLIQ